MKCAIFVGPSAYGIDFEAIQADDIIFLPPAQRGSIKQIRSKLGACDSIALVDGVFGNTAAVSHREILDAVWADIPVWGLCSMGAIRAAEMEDYGVNGFGQVFARFRDNPELPDDEVTHLHSENPYFPISEPMIHLREFLKHLESEKLLNSSAAQQIIGELQNRWFGSRTVRTMATLLHQAGIDKETVAKHVKYFDNFRIKKADFLHFLKIAPWRRQCP